MGGVLFWPFAAQVVLPRSHLSDRAEDDNSVSSRGPTPGSIDMSMDQASGE